MSRGIKLTSPWVVRQLITNIWAHYDGNGERRGGLAPALCRGQDECRRCSFGQRSTAWILIDSLVSGVARGGPLCCRLTPLPLLFATSTKLIRGCSGFYKCIWKRIHNGNRFYSISFQGLVRPAASSEFSVLELFAFRKIFQPNSTASLIDEFKSNANETRTEILCFSFKAP